MGITVDLEAGCIDLRTICNEKRWKWAFDLAIKEDSMRSTNRNSPWYAGVLCRNGMIYPIGGEFLSAYVEGHPRTFNKLLGLKGVSSYQGRVVCKFHCRELDSVAEIMVPRRKRPPPKSTAGIEALNRYRLEKAREKEANNV